MKTKLDKNPTYITRAKFNEETFDKILKYATGGVPLPIAAMGSGMAYSTLKEHMRQGKLELAHGRDTMYSRFIKKLNEINCDQIIKKVALIEAEQKGHNGLQWSLERKYWQYFSSRAPELELAKDMEDLRADIELNKKQDKKEGNENG